MKAFTEADDKAHAYFLIADQQEHNGDIDGAIKSFRAALDLDPRCKEAPLWALNLGFLYQDKRDFDAAIESYQHSIHLGGIPTPRSNAVLYGSLAKMQRKRGDLDDAIKNYKQSITLDPGYANSHHGLGIAMMQQGDLVKAAIHIRRALALDPGDVAAITNLQAIEAQLMG